jgi:hypothetical protein
VKFLNNLLGICLFVAAGTLHPAALCFAQPNPAQTVSWPMVEKVDAQPLLLLTQRLAQTLQTIGLPLAENQMSQLEGLKVDSEDEGITSKIQQIMDPLCVASVVIHANGRTTVIPGKPITLVENGWTARLVKVVNLAASQTKLRIDSPNAKPIPHGPKEEVENRWLALSMFDGRPLNANLSGLELEYRIVQLLSTQVGDRAARLEFHTGLSEGVDSSVIRQWKFDKNSDGWGDSNDLEIEVRDSSLYLKGTGDDPFFSSPVSARGGRMVFRFWGRSESQGVAQLFWWTDQLPQPDGARQLVVPLDPASDREYAIEFPVEGELRGIRLDPLQGPGNFRIDWMNLEYAAGESGTWESAEIEVHTVPSNEVKFLVTDADGSPCMGAFEIRDEHGRVYPYQSKRQAPDFFFQTQIYRESGESIRLPNGKYTVKCSHGPESIVQMQTLEVLDKPVTLTYQVERWIDTAKLGYWSGDHHIHAAGCLHYENPMQGVLPKDMLRHIMGEDVKVGCCLTWGPCFDFQKQFFSGKPDDISRYPYLLRYDIEVSGFGSHQSGHLNLLKLRQQIPAGGDSKHHWPTLGLNTLRWAKSQGAVTGTAHSGAGLTRVIGRVDGDDGPHRLPNFDIPAFDGIGANEFIMQVTHEVDGPDGKKTPAIDFIATMNTPRETEWNIWYHVLNCGFKIVASGETDFPCLTGERLGMGRVYVKLDGLLDYDQWVEALRRGESYVSDGTSHLMNFEQEDDGSFSLTAATYQPGRADEEVELILNGYPVATRKIPTNGKAHELRFEIPKPERSCWVAARIFPSAHTNPIWVNVDDKPVNIRNSAEWCLGALEQCWREKHKTYAADEQAQARMDYDHARKTYLRILNADAE